MIDMGSGPLFSLTEVPDRVPRMRRGRKIHKRTPYRWVKHGVAGIKLWALYTGGTLSTSESALREFFERITALKNPGGAAPGVVEQTPPRMSRGEVEKRLDEIGF